MTKLALRSWAAALVLVGCSSTEQPATVGGASSVSSTTATGNGGQPSTTAGSSDGGSSPAGTGVGGDAGAGGDGHSGVVFACGWETGTIDQGQFATGQVCTDWGANIDGTHSRAGQEAVRLEIRSTDECINGSARAELQITGGNPLIAGTTDFWWAFSTFFPADYVSDESPELFTQAVAQSWPGTGIPFGVWITSDQVSLKRQWYPDGQTSNQASHDLGPLLKDQWVDWVFHIKPAVDDSGLIEIFSRPQYTSSGVVNDSGYVQLLGVSGPNWMAGYLQPYFKVGPYKWQWNHNNPGPFDPDVRVWWLDEFKIGDSSSSIEDFLIPN